MLAKDVMRNAIGLNSRINELADQVRDWKYLKNVIDEPEVNDIYNEVRSELHEAIRMKRNLEMIIMENNNADQRSILRLRYFHGATWAGIADELNDTVEWVKKQHHKALKKIHLEPTGECCECCEECGHAE